MDYRGKTDVCLRDVDLSSKGSLPGRNDFEGSINVEGSGTLYKTSIARQELRQPPSLPHHDACYSDEIRSLSTTILGTHYLGSGIQIKVNHSVGMALIKF
jgi:hypothetical protein